MTPIETVWKWKPIAMSSLTLCDPMDCNLSGSSVHGIFQARILKWVAIPFSRGSSQPRNWTHISCLAVDSLPLSHHTHTQSKRERNRKLYKTVNKPSLQFWKLAKADNKLKTIFLEFLVKNSTLLPACLRFLPLTSSFQLAKTVSLKIWGLQGKEMIKRWDHDLCS